MILDKLYNDLPSSTIPPMLQLATALRFLATGSFQGVIAKDVDISLARSTVSLILWRIIYLIEALICPQWIRLQMSDEEKKKSKSFFYGKYQIPGIVGCIDGTHIKLTKPHKDESLFLNRKGTFSVNAMIDSSINRKSILVSEIAKAREHIKNSLEKMDGISGVDTAAIPSNLLKRLELLEEENNKLKKLFSNLNDMCIDSQRRISVLEEQNKSHDALPKESADEDDGVDLFASDSDEESEETVRIREERLAAYAAKKSKKPTLIAKSSLVLDVKPWDDETNLKAMEELIRKISTDGLLWGASKLVPVAFGISKLSISCIVEDEKVSIDWLTEEIEKNEDYVQSVDVAAFNKI